MRTVKFDSNGGPLTVQVTSGFAVPGTYNLDLYEPDELTVAAEWVGNHFSTPAQNTHDLPAPAKVNDKRILYLDAFVGLMPPDNSYSVTMVVIQDGHPLTPPCSKSDHGTPPREEVRCTLTLAAT